MTALTRKIKGFTLIELLVVIVIIGILISIPLLSFATQLKKARDTQRKSDLKEYQTALVGYSTKHKGLFPSYTDPIDLAGGICNTDLGLTICPDDPLKVNLYKYISNGDGAGGATATKYVVWSKLENSLNLFWVTCSNGTSGYTTTEPTDDSNCPALTATLPNSSPAGSSAPTSPPTTPPSTPPTTPPTAPPGSTPTATPTSIPTNTPIPDLAVTALYLTATPHVGQPLSYDVTYQNLGTADSEIFWHEFVLNGEQVLGWFYISIEAGGSRIFSNTGGIPVAGTNILKANIDPLGHPDLNASNNSMTVTFTPEP